MDWYMTCYLQFLFLVAAVKVFFPISFCWNNCCVLRTRWEIFSSFEMCVCLHSNATTSSTRFVVLPDERNNRPDSHLGYSLSTNTHDWIVITHSRLTDGANIPLSTRFNLLIFSITRPTFQLVPTTPLFTHTHIFPSVTHTHKVTVDSLSPCWEHTLDGLESFVFFQHSLIKTLHF